MKAGSRRVSVFFSAGNFSVGGNGESSCDDGFYALFRPPAHISLQLELLKSSMAENKLPLSNARIDWRWLLILFLHAIIPEFRYQDFISNNLDSSYSGYYNANG
jgi:hypothetical protein